MRRLGHAIRLEQVEILKKAVEGVKVKLHAAATALLDQPEAWLDAACDRGWRLIAGPCV